MLSKMYKKDLDKIAKDKNIPRNKTKIQMIETLVKKLNMDDVRKYYSEFFGTEEFNIFKHDLVPPHRIMSKEEKEKMRKRFGISNFKNFPRIKVSDPVIIAIGGVIGDLIEITRKSPTAGEVKYYRVVFPG